MTTQNRTENDAKLDTTPQVKGAPRDEKPDTPSEVKRELTDEEIEAIAGGTTIGSATGGAGAGKVKFNEF